MITTNTGLISTEQRRLFPRGGPYAPARVAPLAGLMRIDLRRPTGTPLRGYKVPNGQAGSPQVMVGEHQLVQISTSEYKLSPIRRKCRVLLGAPAPDFRRVPRCRFVQQWIGFSTDEVHRVSDRRDVLYLQPRYPLLELGMSRKDCQRWLTTRGWGTTAKSACVGCPFHGDRQWRELRDNHPAEWADAVEFDRAIRKGGPRGLPLNGKAFLHRSRVPLDIAPIDRVTRAEWRDRQGDLLDLLAEEGDPDGCSPYGCRSGYPTPSPPETDAEAA